MNIEARDFSKRGYTEERPQNIPTDAEHVEQENRGISTVESFMSLQLQRESDFVSYVFGKTSGAEICLGSRRVNLRVANQCSLTGQCQIVSPGEALLD